MNCPHNCCCPCDRGGGVKCGLCRVMAVIQPGDYANKCSMLRTWKPHYLCVTCKRVWKAGSDMQTDKPFNDWGWDNPRCSNCRQPGQAISSLIRVPKQSKHRDWALFIRVINAMNSVEFASVDKSVMASRLGNYRFIDSLMHKPRGHNFWLPSRPYEFIRWKHEMLTNKLY